MSESRYDPLSPETWRRGARLGLWMALVFFGSTALVWLLMGLLGWDSVVRALCAMCIGPVFAVALLAGWCLRRRAAGRGLGTS